MCCSEKEGGCQCQCPEELKGKPEECTPAQVEKCHGKGVEHPCVLQEVKK